MQDEKFNPYDPKNVKKATEEWEKAKEGEKSDDNQARLAGKNPSTTTTLAADLINAADNDKMPILRN